MLFGFGLVVSCPIETLIMCYVVSLNMLQADKNEHMTHEGLAIVATTSSLGLIV